MEPPFPNPVPRGVGQTWRIRVAGEGAGSYGVSLVDVAGRLVFERAVRLDVAGWRDIVWDGRDLTGRTAPAGLYFLRCRAPSGVESARKVMVVP
jgi:hypothetical protein